VLAAMFLMAVPFAVFMRMQHSAGTQGLRMAQAHYGETGAADHAKTVLFQTLRSTEQRRSDDFAAGDVEAVFPYDNPDVDSVWEFNVTLRTRLWDDGDADPEEIVIQESGSADYSFRVDRAVGFRNDGDPDTVDAYIRLDDEWMAYLHLAGHGDAINSDTPGAEFPGGTLTVRDEHRGLFGTERAAHTEGAVVCRGLLLPGG